MKKGLGCIPKLWQDLDRVVITQRLRCETDVCDGRKNAAHAHQAQMEIRFSVKKALTVAGSLLMLAAGMVFLWKKCVECKLVSRLKKKYFFLPVDRIAKEAEEQQR